MEIKRALLIVKFKETFFKQKSLNRTPKGSEDTLMDPVTVNHGSLQEGEHLCSFFGVNSKVKLNCMNWSPKSQKICSPKSQQF